MIALLSLLFSAIAGPTMQLDTLAEEADRVIVGEVLTNRTEKDKDTSWTVTTIRVLETLRGDASRVRNSQSMIYWSMDKPN